MRSSPVRPTEPNAMTGLALRVTKPAGKEVAMSDHKHEYCEFCRRFAAYREALEHGRVAGRTRRSNVLMSVHGIPPWARRLPGPKYGSVTRRRGQHPGPSTSLR